MSVAFDLPRVVHNHLISPWNPDMEAELASEWAAGKSGAAIAKAFNAQYGTIFTRSAIIGKVHRSGLPERACGHPHHPRVTPEERDRRLREKLERRAMVAKARGHKAPRPTRAPFHAITPIIDLAIPLEQRKTFAELGKHNCRWIVGDPSADYFFCGGDVFEDHPYCAGHCARAFYRRDR